jgi:predicted permease
MSEIVTIALPFFGLILLGYGVGRWRRVPPEGLAGLNLFVFYVALPALFFQYVAKTPFDTMANWSFLVTTTFATYCAFAIAFSFGALMNRGNVPEATIEGLVGSYANIGYLAPGLTVAAFGAAAAAPTALVFTFDTAMLLTLVPLMMLLGGTERASGSALAKSIARNIALHPLILASFLGFIVSLIGIGLPGPLDALLSFLGSAGAPCALFIVGLGLAGRPLGQISLEMPVLIAIKLIVHPLIVYLLLSWIDGFDSTWVKTAVLMAALPPAMNVLIFARKYGTYASRASTAILVGTAAALVTLTVVLVLLVNEALPVNPFR